MKSLLFSFICFLTVFSSTAMADYGYSYPQNSYPYGATYYSPYEAARIEAAAQREAFLNQRRINNEEANRQIQLERNEQSYQRMREYYQDRRDTERFIGD